MSLLSQRQLNYVQVVSWYISGKRTQVKGSLSGTGQAKQQCDSGSAVMRLYLSSGPPSLLRFLATITQIPLSRTFPSTPSGLRPSLPFASRKNQGDQPLSRSHRRSRGRWTVRVSDGRNAPAGRTLETVAARRRAAADGGWGDGSPVTSARQHDES